MDAEATDWVMGILMVPLGLLGLLMAANAHDSEIYLFGGSLAAFCALFTFGLIKSHYDRADAARHQAAKGADHG